MAPVSGGAGVEIFVSGRLCLFGEHSDWAGGFRSANPDIPAGQTIVIGTQEGLYARVQALEQPVLHISSTNDQGEEVGSLELPLEPKALLKEAQRGGFYSYIAGTAYRIVTAHEVGGLRIDNYRTTLPMSKGLSSSAAICVLVARAFNKVYGLKLTTRGEMEFAYQGEITTPSKCGRMDQACAFGSVPVSMTYDGDLLHIDSVKLGAPLHLVLVDLRAAKDTTTILKDLQSAYPQPSTEEGRRLHELLGSVNQRIVARALQAMADGSVEELGALMREAQREFDERAGPMCPSQLTAPVLHKVLAHPDLQPHIWGGKGVGSQGDGTAQLLCKGPEAQAEVCRIIEGMGMGALPLTLEPTSA